MSLDLISEALNARLNGFSPVTPTFWPNQRWSPTTGVMHFRVAFMPADIVTFHGRNSPRRWVGLYQIGVMAPFGFGAKDAHVRADAVMAHFYRGLNLPNGGITVVIQQPIVAPPVNEGAWFQVPVTARWFCYT